MYVPWLYSLEHGTRSSMLPVRTYCNITLPYSSTRTPKIQQLCTTCTITDNSGGWAREILKFSYSESSKVPVHESSCWHSPSRFTLLLLLLEMVNYGVYYVFGCLFGWTVKAGDKQCTYMYVCVCVCGKPTTTTTNSSDHQILHH